MADQDVHTLERTSPKGGPFVGYCIKCGKRDLTGEQMWEPCPNPGGMTDADALLQAIEGPDHG
jgi:hypothetical protein